MSAIDQLFQDLRSQNKKAFMPFVTAGDPDLDFTVDAVRMFAEQGCSLCELGIPYSDPIADGPVIQASYTRALAQGIKLKDIFHRVGHMREGNSMPLVTMVSYAIVYRHGLEQFVDDAQAVGLAGAIVPDLLSEESAELDRICRERDFSLIQLVTPTTSRERAVRIAETSTGFLYYVSVTGITGARQELPPELADQVGWLKEQTDLPICIGFGIARPDHVRTLAPVADGLIVGSAIVKQMAQVESKGRNAVLGELQEFIQEMLASLGD
ncbi:MAG: tryptophan synthase subunit alpha [Planctomycetaceae bacterium]|nr:tryptophan synthase subunit alpha [Planctomycetaceae bacterium]